MYDYKQIGNLAAKVVSVLAIAGGALWWQRASTSYPAPQPQDEAEIMTACIERTMAITGNTNFQFTTTHPANVSQRITGNNYVTLLIASSIQSNGLNWVYDGSANPHTWPIGKAATLGPYYNGSIGDLIVSISGAADFSGNVWFYAQTPDGASQWYNISATPLPMTLTGGSAGDLTISTTAGTVSNYSVELPIYTYVTNSPAHTDTNTVGMFPNATYQYPATIRSALSPSGGRSWILPPSSYMSTGADPGYITNFPATHLDSDTNWWTNWVTLAQGQYYTTTNWSTTNIVWTNFPPATNWFSQTNILWYSGLITNAVTNGVDSGKLFAFERDKKQLPWSTNAYNDMGRALSLMQWQEGPVSVSTIGGGAVYTWNPTNSPLPLIFSWDQVGISYGSGGIPGSSPPGGLPSGVFSINPSFAVCAEPYYRMQINCYSGGSKYMYYGGSTFLQFYFVNSFLMITNPTPFTWTNISIYATNTGFVAQGLNGATLGNYSDWATNTTLPWSYQGSHGSTVYWDFSYYFGFWTNWNATLPDFATTIINNRQAFFTTNACLPPGQSMTFSFPGFDLSKEFTDATNQATAWFNGVASLANALPTVTNGTYTYSSQPPYSSGILMDIPSAPLPFVLGNIADPETTYRVQFQSLTDYTKHAPIR